MSSRLALLTLALAAALPAAAQRGPACLLSAELPRRAWVGEQLVFRVEILRRPAVSSATWLRAPSFPSFRSDALPGRSGTGRIRKRGIPYLVFEERHAIFPVRSGLLTLPSARLQCTLHAAPGDTAVAVEATLPARRIQVDPPPSDGRPEDWSGLVGRVEAQIWARPDRVRLGDSLHVEVSLQGDADLRSAEDPFGGAREIDGLELFPQEPRLRLDPGEKLRLRRSFGYAVVPRRPGTRVLPAVRVPYFDPGTGRYAVAETRPVPIQVEPAEPPAGR